MDEKRADDRCGLLVGGEVDRCELVHEAIAVVRADELALHVAGAVEPGDVGGIDLDVEREAARSRGGWADRDLDLAG